MFISHLSLTDFRNYRHLELSLPPCLVVIQGDNAQGKTNLLEAVLVLAISKSHRASSDRDLVYRNADADSQPFARLVAEVQRERGEIKVEIVLRGEGAAFPAEPASVLVRKRIRVNGIYRRAVDLVGQVNAVIFSAQDIDLTGGTPSLCRRYLDSVSSQTDSLYLRSLQQYQKVLLQRNHLLRLLQEHRAKPEQLEFWDQELVESGSYLIRHRQHLVASLNELAEGTHQELSGGRERLKIVYLPSVGKEGEKPGEIQSEFHQALHRLRGKEIGQGMTLAGPHRDNLQFEVDGADVGRYGSRGQQRTTVLSLKLAEAKYIHTRAGDSPILLLDDVLSELDQARCQHLLEFILPFQQALITTTDLDRFEPSILARASQFKVRQGNVEII
ncbi:DNA replication/repair protein RecF [Chloroflexota bacterium]